MCSRRFLHALVVVSVWAGALGCMREAADTRAADEQTIRAAEIKAVEALDAGDVDAYMAAYPEGSVWLPPNSPSVSGPEAIRALASQLAAGPDFAFHVEPTTVEVSRSGDLAYLVGSFQMTVNDATGNPVTDRGKFVEVWRKHPDQTWKHVLAIWNSDEPPQK